MEKFVLKLCGERAQALNHCIEKSHQSNVLAWKISASLIKHSCGDYSKALSAKPEIPFLVFLSWMKISQIKKNYYFHQRFSSIFINMFASSAAKHPIRCLEESEVVGVSASLTACSAAIGRKPSTKQLEIQWPWWCSDWWRDSSRSSSPIWLDIRELLSSFQQHNK